MKVQRTDDHTGRPPSARHGDRQHLDHRIAMSFAVAGIAAKGETELLQADCVDISYPGFYRDLLER